MVRLDNLVVLVVVELDDLALPMMVKLDDLSLLIVSHTYVETFLHSFFHHSELLAQSLRKYHYVATSSTVINKNRLFWFF